jgi:hypothetical protein
VTTVEYVPAVPAMYVTLALALREALENTTTSGKNLGRISPAPMDVLTAARLRVKFPATGEGSAFREIVSPPTVTDCSRGSTAE